MKLASLVSLAVLVASSSLTGCASIVSGNTQIVSVETRLKGEPVSGASCELENPKGKFFVTTPGTVSVSRAFDDMTVKCQKPGVAGMKSFKSSTKAMAFGNIIFGGVIGAAVDTSTGAAFDYPILMSVDLSDSLAPAALPLANTLTLPAVPK